MRSPRLHPALFSMLLDEDARATPFLPSSLGNLAAWYRKGVGMTDAGGGACSQWMDQSGNARHLLQPTGGIQPLIQGDGSILFDGVDDAMKATFAFAQPMTIFTLFKQVTWTGSDVVWVGNSGGTTEGRLSQIGTTPNLRATSDTSGATLDTNPDLALDTSGVVTVVLNGASSLVQVNSNAAVTGDAAANGMAGICLGARTLAGVNAANIQVKEIVAYSDAKGASEIAAVIAYLNTL